MITKSLVAFPLACLLSYLFYKLGAGAGSGSAKLAIGSGPDIAFNRNSESPLRGNRPPSLNHTKKSLVAGAEARPIVEENVPSCARDVFLTLHKELGGEGEASCRGLLISDDILVTSRACAELEFTFDFPGYGVARAAPHALLNSHAGMTGSRLGFLETTPPYHYAFLGKPRIRRTPAFLGHQSDSATSGDGEVDETGAPSFIDCVDGRVPVARGFPVDGEVVSLGHLAGVVPGEILWEETDLYTAIELKYKKHRWWTRPVTLDEEIDEIKELFEPYRGPPGSVSVPDAHSNFVSAAAGLFEVVDPRGHRRMDCFKNYLMRYMGETPFSGMHFFDWLDFGHGRHIMEKNEKHKMFPPMRGDDTCTREHFDSHTVHYFNDDERREHEIYIEPAREGRQLIARYRHNDEPVPASHPENPHLYMWDLNGTFYVVDGSWDKERYGRIKHTAVLAGGPALSGGKAYFGKQGSIWGINYSSGHYRPSIGALAMMYQWMKDRGLNTTALHWVGRDVWSRKTCGETNWKHIKIPGYDSSDLERSCNEVTRSPTWMVKEDV